MMFSGLNWFVVYVNSGSLSFRKFKYFKDVEKFLKEFDEDGDSWIDFVTRAVFLEVGQNSGIKYEPLHSGDQRKKKRKNKRTKK